MAFTMPGSMRRATGTPRGRCGSAMMFSTPIHSDWMSRSLFSPAKVPGGCVATRTRSMSPPLVSGQAWKRSPGSAFCSSGNQKSGFSFSEAKRMFIRRFARGSAPGLEAGGLDHRAPLVVVALVDARQLGRPEPRGLHAVVVELGAHVRGVDPGADRLGKAVDHRGRRPRRRVRRVPARALD